MLMWLGNQMAYLYYSVKACRRSTVPIKSIRRSQVTGLLPNLTKGHRGHRSQMELTNLFFGPPKWLPKALKLQKIAYVALLV